MSWSALLGFFFLSWFPVLVSHPSLTSPVCAACLWQNERCHLSLGLAEAVGRGIEIFSGRPQCLLAARSLKKGAFQRKLCVMWLHLLSGIGWKKGEHQKGARERGRGKERSFCQGHWKFLSCGCTDLLWFGFSLCMLSKSFRDFHSARGASEETETGSLFNSPSSHPILCGARRQTLYCTGAWLAAQLLKS